MMRRALAMPPAATNIYYTSLQGVLDGGVCAHVEQEGEIDPVVVIVAQVEAALIAAQCLVEVRRVAGELPEPLVHRSPKAQRLGVV